jgi:uncharacterized protein (TIGR00661 family)
MKILYAIQGTGNGHMAVARETIPILKKIAQVDILVSGCQVDVDLPYEIRYRLNGLSFIFGKKGGIDYLETYKKSNVKSLFKEIQNLPVHEYDLVVSDFEPVSAWACYLKNKTCIGFSHQAAVINKHSPKPSKKDLLGKAVLKHYAPATYQYGFHFLPYDKNVFTPIIRKEIRSIDPVFEGYYTVYLPAYSDKRIIKMLSQFPHIEWQVFSKHCSKAYRQEHISVQPISNDAFVHSIAGAEGVLCGAGFQTPAEVLYLQKKLLVIPMKGQYEQQCNAAALKMLGVPVLKNLKAKHYPAIKQWLDEDQKVAIAFPDETEEVLELLIDKHYRHVSQASISELTIDKPSKFRELLLKKIFYQLGS